MEEQISKDKLNQVLSMSEEIISLARDILTVRFRFFDVPLYMISFVPKEKCGGFFSCNQQVLYDPKILLKSYMKEPGLVTRLYLHEVLHMIFMHEFNALKLEKRYWDLATDIAVENIILEFDIPEAKLSDDTKRKQIIDGLSKKVEPFTAEKLYKEFLNDSSWGKCLEEYEEIFSLDVHKWYEKDEATSYIRKEDMEKLARRIKTELEAFSKDKNNSVSLYQNIKELTKEHYDYREILKAFTVQGEEVTVNDDEFDYIYYTYGLDTYGDMPLVEPLEYREVNKIKEFVIAIDTSASCRGEIVKKFLEKTYNILLETESFFSKVNLHIVQCDAQLRRDTHISSALEFEEFVRTGKLEGFGGTDFRPVFEYVDELIEKGEFENLKGLIYFTDGYGVYPERMPSYDVMFAFLNEDNHREKVPGWAMEVILEDELNEH
ncbi:MAG: hypothetical protein J6J16_04190 [Lachnospiraceae bacterium]|nr:hypothetical protein [Lachnospiraceae bacterium]